MAAAVSVLLGEESLLCGICLELLKEAVTIPCGHTFCLGCIQSCWGEPGRDRRCPHCRQNSPPAAQLRRNLLLCKIVDDFTSSRDRASVGPEAEPGNVSCDFCTGTKMGAAKSCSVCLVSYCELHLKPHRENAAFQHHSLTEPVGDLTHRRCPAHGKLLDLFCRTDRNLICSFCTTERHRNHQTVTVEEEVSKRKTFELIKRKQVELFHKAPEAERENIECNPYKIFHQGLENCKPIIGLTTVQRGGKNYQVPTPLKDNRRRFLAMKWLITQCHESKSLQTHMSTQLAQELLAAFNNKGNVVKRKHELHKMAEANRAFAHYRWW